MKDHNKYYTLDSSRNKSSPSSRRDFMRSLSTAGIGMFGISAFIQSCAKEEIFFSTELTKHYIEGLLGIIAIIKERELPKIRQAAGLAVQTRLLGHKVYASLSDGMLQNEIEPSRPGNLRVFILDDVQNAEKGDLVITGDPEKVRGFSERMIKIIGITKPSILNSDTPPYTLENMGTFRIEDFSDIIINCHVPYKDGILPVEGIDIPICPASGIIRSAIYHSLVAEIVTGLTRNGIYPELG